MKGHMQDGKFHPHRPYKSIRKKRSPETLEGVKIINKLNPKSQQSIEMIKGITESFAEQPKRIREKIHTITFKNKKPSEDWVAKIDTTEGEATFNKKPNLSEGDYKALGDHEFQHIDFNEKLEEGNRKYDQFIKDGN